MQQRHCPSLAHGVAHRLSGGRRADPWRPLARTARDDQLLLEQKILRDHRSHATGATQRRGHDGPVKQGKQEVFHARDSVGQTSGATQRGLNPGYSEKIGNSRRTGGPGGSGVSFLWRTCGRRNGRITAQQGFVIAPLFGRYVASYVNLEADEIDRAEFQADILELLKPDVVRQACTTSPRGRSRR